MASLKDFAEIKERLATSKKQQVEALHEFVFETAGNRCNRQRLRDFTGFEYDNNDARFATKMEYVSKKLDSMSLLSICLLLGINHNAKDLKLHIFKNLCKDTLLKDLVVDSENNEGEEEEAIEGDQVNEDENANEDNNINATMYDDARSVVSSIEGRNSNYSHKSNIPHFSLNFRDVEDSIRPFCGNGTIPVEKWLQEFDEMALLMEWTEFHKMIFAKKALKGNARLYVMSERGLNTWSQLRNALLEEFGQKINSAQLHKMLCEREMKPNESLQEYMYNMKDLAAQGNIEDSALIQHIIDGIRDTHINKAMLYGAQSMKEFKIKLNTYEIFLQKQKPQLNTKKTYNERLPQRKTANETKQETKSRCYKCGSIGHISTNCTTGIKCFKCNKLGHVSKDCRSKNSEERPNNVNLVAKDESTEQKKNDLMMKEVTMCNQKNVALFDTGSALNLIKLNSYQKLEATTLSKSELTLKGFGNKSNVTKTIGKFDADVEIDDNTFNLQFHVVNDDCMNVHMVIGKPICEQAEITINSDGVHIKKLEEIEIMHIKTDDDEIEIDIGDTASKNSQNIIKDIVKNYKPEAKKYTNVAMKITLTDETPIACGPRRLPLMEKHIVEEQVKQWLNDGIIENSESEFSSPIVLVNKKDGGKRLCIDYRKINKVIIKDRFPLPLIEDQLDRLKNATWFSTIDLKNGFFHVKIEPESRKYTSFVTHSGQFQYLVVPFGLSNSPAVFQRHVNAIFREMTCRGVALPYVDDIIIPGNTEEEALENLQEVLAQCQDYGLRINWKKCHFLKREIEFLGYVIKDCTISPSPTKKEVMLKYPLPKTIKQLESFLGLAGYFRKFIPDFAIIAMPLSDLKKKNAQFHMGQAQINSFNMLKQRLNESPVLKIFNEEHETELHTDASKEGYGAVLIQRCPDDGKLHPVHYMSKKTTELEKKYGSYELEILAVIEALKKFRVYLLGINFKIVTDCNAFATTMNKKDLSTRVARWLLLLQEYTYTIEHRSGAKMKHVDALSRYAVMTIDVESLTSRIVRAQQNDDDLQPILKILEDADSYKGFYLKSKVLYKLVNECELIVIPKSMEYELIKSAHEKGHFSVQKTRNLLSDYYIPKVEEKIQKILNNCIECVLINKKRGKQEGELNPLLKQDVPLQTYHVDHLGPLESTSKQYKHIFAVIDGFTKFCWLYPTKSTTAKEVVSKLQLQSVTFGNPKVIISDRGTAFTAEEFESYCAEEGIKHHLITTGLPRANGQIERLNSVIIAVLSKLSINEPTKWYKHVDKVQQYINSMHHRGINASPFEILIGSKMRCKEDIQVKQMIEEEMIIQYDEMRQQLRSNAKEQIAKIQDENKCRYNLRRKPAMKYKVGDVVAIKRTQYGGGLKLRAKYLGPYAVTTVKPKDTYDVQKIGNFEGPNKTTTCAEYMKIWPNEQSGTFESKE